MSTKRNSDAADAMRQLRARRKAEGKCIYCENPLETTTLCADHAAKVRKYKDAPKRESGHRYPVERRSKRDPNRLVGPDWREYRSQ